MIFEIRRKLGSWLYFFGFLFIFFSYSSQSMTITAWSVFSLGVVLILSDPILYSVEQIRNLSLNLNVYSYILGVFSIFLFLIRSVYFSSEAAEETSFQNAMRNVFLVLFIFFFLTSILLRFSLQMSQIRYGSESNDFSFKKSSYMLSFVFSILTAVVVFVFINYLSVIKNPILDFSPGYYSFSSNAESVIRSLKRPVQIYAFLPVQQAVSSRSTSTSAPTLFRIAEDVKLSLEQLPVLNSGITINFINADLESEKLAEFGSVGNGTILFRVANRSDRVSRFDKPYTERKIFISTEKDLQSFEREVVRSLIQVSSPPAKIYYTASNGERDFDLDKMYLVNGMDAFKSDLAFYNYSLHRLDEKNNWPGKLPEDIDVLFIAGPTVPFSEDAKNILKEYLKKGGHLWVSSEKNSRENFSWLLGDILNSNYRYKDTALTNVNSFPGTPITDFVSDHRTTENLKQIGKNILVFPNSGFLERVKTDSPGKSDKELSNFKITEIIKTTSSTFLDANRNGKKEPGEISGSFPLALAFEKEKGAKIVFFAGTDWISNMGFNFPVKNNNSVLASDSLFWMTENPLAAGLKAEPVESRSIQVTDDMKFNNMIFGIVIFPVLIVLVTISGVMYYRKKQA